MDNFQVILLEGLFYERDGQLHVEQDDGQHLVVQDALAPVLGQRIQLAFHHVPPHGVQVDKPGAGSCRFPGGTGCPVRHDQHPTRMLSFVGEGVLHQDPWRVVKFDGTVTGLPLAGMVGHYGRLGATMVADLERMREAVAKMDPTVLSTLLGARGVDAGELEATLARLRERFKR